jgi:hypothetical protein
MKFEEKMQHPWSCDSSRGDRPCRWVFPNGDEGEGFLCCTWKDGHPETLPHETLYTQDEKSVFAEQNRWEYRPDLTIFEMGRYSQ